MTEAHTVPGLPEYRDGHLAIDGHAIASLAGQHQTPFFLISEGRLRANYAALLRGLGAEGAAVRVRYCVKTNSEAGVLAVLARCGSDALVSHPAEAELALRCGFGPERLAYQRPVLTAEDVSAVAGMGIDLLHAYRPEDLDLIDGVAARIGRRLRVSLRLRNEAVSPLGFLSRRLGLRASEVVAAAERVVGSKGLALAGINFYCGTQQEAVAAYRGLLRRVVRLAGDLPAGSVEEIDLGGGLPSPSLRRNSLGTLWARLRDTAAPLAGPERLEAFARELAAVYRREAGRLRALPRLVVEPGRSIVGNAGFLVSRVRAVQGRWAFLDASSNYLGESTLLFTRRILTETQPAAAATRLWHLSGATLNTRDVIDLGRRLPLLSAGDLVVLCDAGAYSLSRASRYAGLSPAVHLLAEDGSLRTVRRAEGLGDLAGPMVMAG